MGIGVFQRKVPKNLEVPIILAQPFVRGPESMVMKFHGNVRGEVRVNFLTFFCLKTPHFHVRFPPIVPNCSRERSLEHCHSHAFCVPKQISGPRIAGEELYGHETFLSRVLAPT